MNNVIPLRPLEGLKSSQFIVQTAEAPILRQAVFLLREVSGREGIKLTATGTFPRSVVQKFWTEQIQAYEKFSFKPYKHADCRELIKVSFLLEEAKLIRRVRNR